MFSTREWLTIVTAAVAGTVVVMTLRAMLFAARIALYIAVESVSVMAMWMLVVAVVVWLLRRRAGQKG